MELLLNIIEKILNQGVAAASGEFEKKRVRLTNQLALTSLVVVLFFITFSVVSGNLSNLPLQAPLLIALSIPSIILNRLNLFRAARLTLVTCTSLQVTIDACIGGRIESHHFYFMPIAVGTGMLFRANEPRSLCVGISIPLACLFALELSDFSLLSRLFPIQTEQIAIRYFNLTVSYLVAAFIGWRLSALFIQSELRSRNAAKMMALGEMASGISHEINNPLTIISVSVDSARRKMESGSLSTQEIGSTFDRIKLSSQRVARIIDGLRKFARQDSHDPIVFVDIGKMVEIALTLIRTRIHQDQIQVVTNGQANLEICCRESDILRALVNVLSNAIDAVEPQKIRKITLEWGIVDANAELSVTDTGTGIPAEIIDKLGQPFFTTKDEDKGTGLGLSIATGLVRANDGILDLDRDSKNTRFVFRFKKFRSSMAKHAREAA